MPSRNEVPDMLYGSSKIPRSSYCLRHTYATFRLMEGVDVYFLAKKMGTSVRMIEDHYGHITPSKNADLILQGIPGWEPVNPGLRSAEARSCTCSTASVAAPDSSRNTALCSRPLKRRLWRAQPSRYPDDIARPRAGRRQEAQSLPLETFVVFQ
jgi:hypothetical protein